MTGRVYILFLPFWTSPVVQLSAFAQRSRYAGISLFLCALLWPVFSPADDVDSFGIREYRTETGEQRAIPLADGSTVFLDVESTLRIPSNEGRKVYLDRGQAAFEVERNAAGRPLTVQIDQATVHAERSNFHVRRKGDLTVVSIIKGELRVVSATGAADVPSAKPRTGITVGRQLIISPDGSISTPTDVSIVFVSMWRERRLAFRHHTLVEIADEFNRYNKSPKLRIEGESLKLRTFSGVMDANDPQTLLDYLAGDERIEFNRDDPDLIIVRFRSRYGFARVGR
jgi:transmembrane sensor